MPSGLVSIIQHDLLMPVGWNGMGCDAMGCEGCELGKGGKGVCEGLYGRLQRASFASSTISAMMHLVCLPSFHWLPFAPVAPPSSTAGYLLCYWSGQAQVVVVQWCSGVQRCGFFPLRRLALGSSERSEPCRPALSTTLSFAPPAQQSRCADLHVVDWTGLILPRLHLLHF